MCLDGVFFVRQHIESGEIVVKWCPTEDMVADIMTKQLTGQLFKDMRDKIVHDMYVDPKCTPVIRGCVEY